MTFAQPVWFGIPALDDTMTGQAAIGAPAASGQPGHAGGTRYDGSFFLGDFFRITSSDGSFEYGGGIRYRDSFEHGGTGYGSFFLGDFSGGHQGWRQRLL